MKRLLVIAAFVVLLAAVLLVWKLRGGTDDVVAANKQGASAVPVESGEPATPFAGSNASSAPPQGSGGGRQPGVVVTPGANGEISPQTAPQYQVGNITVRDHRQGSNHAPMDIPPNIHAPDARKVSSTLVSELTQKMREIVRACTKDVPPEARGPKPRLEGEINIAIKDHKVAVNSSVMKLRDVVGASVDPTQACVEKGALGLTHVAPDESDVTTYQINLSFAVL